MPPRRLPRRVTPRKFGDMSDDSAQKQDVRIEPSWKARLGAQFAAPHMAGLGNFPPPSLQNIYKELATDLGVAHPGHGNLESWARQGVLLLNACLTVEDGRAGSHQGKGWEPFTDAVISALNRERENLVFILWGRKAQDKGAVIDRERHLVLTSVHPSPLSASNGFFGSRPFSAANAWLERHGMTPIDWRPS